MLFRKRAQRKRRRIRKLRLFALLIVLVLVSAASFSAGLITAIAGQLPSLDPRRAQAGEVDGYVYADNGHAILAVLRGKEARELVGWDDISPWMKHAIVDVEDKRFYEHRGVDVHGIVRALWEDVRHKSTVQGGSTITQQFVKNALIHNERTISRKLKEAALAWQLEQRHRDDKDWILTAYLNTIYFGNGAYGIGQAALTYFQKPASKLTLPEAALLAGIPRDPSLFDPVTNPKAAKERRRVVLDQMLQQGRIAPDQYHAARSAALPAPDKVHLPGTRETQGQYFVNYVKQQLVSDPEYGPGAVFGGGLRIHTTLDPKIQGIAEASVKANVEKNIGRNMH
ncbi:MAG: transglycosylase domain-containing protein, partial [Gaiellaceae bacterium]